MLPPKGQNLDVWEKVTLGVAAAFEEIQFAPLE